MNDIIIATSINSFEEYYASKFPKEASQLKSIQFSIPVSTRNLPDKEVELINTLSPLLIKFPIVKHENLQEKIKFYSNYLRKHISSVMLFINVISSVIFVYFCPSSLVKFFRNEYFDKITVLFTSFPGPKNKIKFCNK